MASHDAVEDSSRAYERAFTPEPVQGSHGTTMARCYRDDLGWPPGKWSIEPDVVAWLAGAWHVILSRDTYGRWFKTFIAGDESESARNRLANFEAMFPDLVAPMLRSTGSPLLFNMHPDFFEELGLINYGVEYDLIGNLGMMVVADANTWAPSWKKGPTLTYIDVGMATRDAGRVLRALCLDDRLLPGQLMGDVLAENSPIERYDVAEIVALYKVKVGYIMALKTWSDNLAIHWAVYPEGNSWNSGKANAIKANNWANLSAMTAAGEGIAKLEAVVEDFARKVGNDIEPFRQELSGWLIGHANVMLDGTTQEKLIDNVDRAMILLEQEIDR